MGWVWWVGRVGEGHDHLVDEDDDDDEVGHRRHVLAQPNLDGRRPVGQRARELLAVLLLDLLREAEGDARLHAEEEEMGGEMRGEERWEAMRRGELKALAREERGGITTCVM